MNGREDIDGPWEARKDSCGFGYKGTWVVTGSDSTDGSLTITEQWGARCCGCVPNPVPKTHKMQKDGPGGWSGTKGCKPIFLKKVSEHELRHMTTDGMMTMLR